jgi:serine/threonine protein kinase
MLLLMEWMEGGSLYSALDNHSVMPLLPRLRISIARNIADGLQHLHANSIIHRDIKSLNVLLTSDSRAKLCDFGLATLQTLTSTRTGGKGGTYPWSAPEIFQGASCDEKTDIYAFGVVMWELLTCMVPFEGLSETQVRGLVERAKRPEKPRPLPIGFSPAYIQLMERCWHQVMAVISRIVASFDANL